MLKAIETRYKGCRFRSRLEARWAVFFDALGWGYKYENQGFVLPNGTPYLPDFEVRANPLDMMVEVKSDSLTGDEFMTAIEKLSFFITETKGHLTALLLSGMPGEHRMAWLAGVHDEEKGPTCGVAIDIAFGECPMCRSACLVGTSKKTDLLPMLLSNRARCSEQGFIQAPH